MREGGGGEGGGGAEEEGCGDGRVGEKEREEVGGDGTVGLRWGSTRGSIDQRQKDRKLTPMIASLILGAADIVVDLYGVVGVVGGDESCGIGGICGFGGGWWVGELVKCFGAAARLLYAIEVLARKLNQDSKFHESFIPFHHCPHPQDRWYHSAR